MKISTIAKAPRGARLVVLSVLTCIAIHPFELFAQAEATAKLSLHIVDSAGVSHTPAFVIYEAGGLRYGQPELSVEDVHDIAKFIQTVRTGTDPVSTYLRSQIYPKGVPPEAHGLSDDDQDAANAAFITALNKMFATVVLFDATRFAQVKRTPDLEAEAAVIQQLGAQTTMVLIKTFNRVCLEAAYPGMIVRCNAVFVGDEATPQAVVAAGEYWLVPMQTPTLLKRVTVKPGETLDVASPAPNTLWFTFVPVVKGPSQLMLIQLKPPAERRAMLGAYRTYVYFGVSRPGVSEADRAAALKLARREFAQRTATPLNVAGLSNEEQTRRTYYNSMALNNALRILAVTGDASDAALILSAPTENYYDRLTRAEAAGYLESRLGRLSHGELAVRLKSPEPEWATSAAIQLHRYGLAQGDAVLQQSLQNLSLKKTTALSIPIYVGDDGSAAMVSAVRANYAMESTPPNDTSVYSIWPAARYLLAYGAKEDWARVDGVTWYGYQAEALLPQYADPMPIVKSMASDYRGLVSYEPYLRANPATGSKIANQLETEIFAAATPGATIAADREPGFLVLNTYAALVSFCRPTSRAAQLYFNQVIPMDETQWLPAPWRRDEIFDSLFKGNLRHNWDYQLDYIPDAQFAQEMAKRDASAGKFDGEDLLIAAHQLVSHAFKSDNDHYADGVERRPFGFQDQEKQGAIIGVFELHPSLTGNKLTLDFRFRMSPHYNVGSMIDFNEGDKTKWAHHKYVINGGRQLIEKASLRVGNRTLPLTDLGSKDGGAFLAEAMIDQTSLDGVLADVDLEYLGQHYTVTFDLFASDLAKTLRRAAAKSP